MVPPTFRLFVSWALSRAPLRLNSTVGLPVASITSERRCVARRTAARGEVRPHSMDRIILWRWGQWCEVKVAQRITQRQAGSETIARRVLPQHVVTSAHAREQVCDGALSGTEIK